MNIECIDDQVGLDVYFPGCENYYQKSRPDFLPYELWGFHRFRLKPRNPQVEAMERQRRVNPSCMEEACAYGHLPYVVSAWAQGESLEGGRVKYEGSDATPLMWSVLRGHLPIARFLIDQKVNLHATTLMGHTALHWAVTSGSYDAVRLLLDHGADPTRRDGQGYSPYFAAAQCGNAAMLLLLCEFRPVDVKERDEEGHTLLHWAAYANSPVMCQFLIERCRVEMDALDQLGRTALHWAAREGFAEVAEYLVSHGARTELSDAEECTPLKHAVLRNHRETVYVLSKHPAARRNGITASVEGGVSHSSDARRRWIAKGYQTVAQLRQRGTMRFFMEDPLFLCMGILGVLHVLLSNVITMIIPPALSHLPLCMFFFRNSIWVILYGYPHQGSRMEPSMMQKMGVARNFAESARGSWICRNRDVACFLVLMSFLLLQQRAWSMLGLSPLLFVAAPENVALTSMKTSTVYEESKGFFFNTQADLEQFVTIFMLITVVVSAVLCKLLSMWSVYHMNGSLEQSPVWSILHQRAYRWLHPRTCFIERHSLIPLRSFYCYERDVVLKRYDGYSIALDCPIAESNHVLFVVFVTSFACLQWLIFFWGWFQASELMKCPAPTTVAEWLFMPSWNLFIHALPCADTQHVVGATWGPWLSYLRYILPTSANHYAVWVLQYGFVAAVMSSFVAMRQWLGVWFGATRMELANPTATGSEGGGLVSIFPPNPSIRSVWLPPDGITEGMDLLEEEYTNGTRHTTGPMALVRHWRQHCIYANGKGLVNVASFFLGTSGKRWRGAMAVSNTNTPVYTVAPMSEGGNV